MSKARDVADSYTDVEVDAKDATLQTQVNDRYTKSESDGRYVTLASDQTITGSKTLQNRLTMTGTEPVKLNFFNSPVQPYTEIRFNSAVNPNSDWGYINYTDHSTLYTKWGTTTENSVMTLGVTNDGQNPNSDVVAIASPAGVFLDTPEAYVGQGASANVIYHTGNHQQIGVGQTWQDVRASRSAGVTYTNNTNKPILVSVYGGASAGGGFSLIIDGITINSSFEDDSSDSTALQGIVPSGSTYGVLWPNGVYAWFELR
jgi:hypothetical protein